MQQAYAIIWEFEVVAEAFHEFERHYASEGSWVRLFRNSADFVGTLMLKDRERPQRYLTIDRWSSEAAYQAFRERYASEYEDLDALCEPLTLSERRLGNFSE